MSGRSIEEWARMCVYRHGIADCIIGDVCVWHVMTHLSAEQRHAHDVQEVRVWMIPEGAFEFGFIQDIITKYTVFLSVY